MLIRQLGPRDWRIEAWVKVAAFNRIADADYFADPLKWVNAGLSSTTSPQSIRAFSQKKVN